MRVLKARQLLRLRYYDRYDPANDRSAFGIQQPVTRPDVLPPSRLQQHRWGEWLLAREVLWCYFGVPRWRLGWLCLPATCVKSCSARPAVLSSCGVVYSLDLCGKWKVCAMDSLASDDLLIEEVRRRPLLYDQRLKTYRDKQLQRDAWEQVSRVLGQNGKCESSCHLCARQRR